MRQERRIRKVLAVCRHNELRIASNRCRKNVSVIAIGQAQAVNQPFMSCHDAVGHCKVNEMPDALNLLMRNVGPGTSQASHPLAVDGVRPACPKQSGCRKLQEQIS